MSTQAVEDFAEAAQMVGLSNSRIQEPPELNTLLIVSCSAASPRARNANRFYLAARLLENTGTPWAAFPRPFALDLEEAPITGCSCELLNRYTVGPDDPSRKAALVSFWSDYPGTAPGWMSLQRGLFSPDKTRPTKRLGTAESQIRSVQHGLTFEEMALGFGLNVYRPITRRLTRPSRAFHAFSELRQWLSLTAAETAELVGVKRTTPNAWEREGREPRPSSARRLYQLHSVVKAVVSAFGTEAAMRWLDSGKPSPRKMLIKGEIDAASRSAERLLIGTNPLPGAAPGSLLEEPTIRPSTPRATTRRRDRRRRQGPRS